MKLGIKEILIIALSALFSFPVMMGVMMVVTGRVKIVVPRTEKELADSGGGDIKFLHHNKKMDSLEVAHSEAYLALVSERAELQKEREALNKQQERINMLSSELDRRRAELEAEKKAFEAAAEKSKSASAKKIKQLAKVYGAMKPLEAARILETLDDALTIKIIRAIGDERQKGKIMSALSKEKASRISKKMGS